MKGLDAVADAFAGATVYSDVIDAANFQQIAFLLHKGVGTTGTSTVTVEACDDTTPSNTTAAAFRYRKSTTGDTWGALTDVASTGVATTAGSSQLYVFIADPRDIIATGYRYVRLKCAEVVDSEVLGGIIVIGLGNRYTQAIMDSQID